jgi:hypothetical protein
LVFWESSAIAVSSYLGGFYPVRIHRVSYFFSTLRMAASYSLSSLLISLNNKDLRF